jgi:hypothetical protein
MEVGLVLFEKIPPGCCPIRNGRWVSIYKKLFCLSIKRISDFVRRPDIVHKLGVWMYYSCTSRDCDSF